MIRIRTLVVTAAVVPLAAAAGVAAAQPMGQVGQVVVDGSASIALRHQSTDSDFGESVTAIQLAPAASFFVAPNVSVGGLVFVVHQSAGDESTTSLGLGGSFGYLAALGPQVSLWPSATLAYEHASYESDDGLGDPFELSGYKVVGQLSLPLLFHPADHVFLGGGPVVRSDLIAKIEGEDGVEATTLGFESVVGGYF